MKNVIFMFLLLFISSCDKDENQTLTSEESKSIIELSKELKKDPIAVQYFEAVGEYQKMHAEIKFDRRKFSEILESGEDFCNSSSYNLDQNVEIKNMLNMICLIREKRQNFLKKYPTIQKMDKGEKLELIGLMKMQKTLDTDLIKENFENALKEISPETKEELVKLMENKPDVNFKLLEKSFDLDEKALKNISKEYLKKLNH